MQPDRWRLVPYVLASGRSPVQEFMDGLEDEDPDALAYFHDVLLPLLSTNGSGVGSPHFERLKGTDFCEIRWHGKDNGHHRIYCSIETERRLVLLHALTKRWRKFEADDRAICEQRYTDFHSADYDAQARRNSRD